MGLQNITEVIINEGMQEAELIIKNAQEMADAFLEKQKQQGIHEASVKAASLFRKAEKEAEGERLRKVANAKASSKWIVLARKEALIEKVLDESKKRLQIMIESKEYFSLLPKLIIEAGVVLGGGDLEVLLNKRDTTLPLKFGGMEAKISEKTGSDTKLRLCEQKTEATGGAMVRTKDRKIVMDNTFEDRIRRKDRELRYAITGILFE